MRKEYGVTTKEIGEMTFEEFKALLSGMGPNTALGRVVEIRSETDSDVISQFTQDQRRIHVEWQNRMAQNVTEQGMEDFLNEMLNMFKGMEGSDGK